MMSAGIEALSGTTVIDLTELLPGPYATLLMQQLGAKVVKIEKPGGDAARTISPGMFRVLNGGKTCLRLDLKQPEGLGQIEQMLREADVLVESFRPGVLHRLGLPAARLRELNPRLIVVSLTGYGQTGPLRELPGHDINYAAIAGLAAISGSSNGAPSYDSGLPVADMAGAMFALTAVLGALLKRAKTGEGEHLDVAIADSLLHWMTPRLGARMNAPALDADGFRRHLHARPGYGFFQAGCGRWLALGALETPFWKRLVLALELDACATPAFEEFAYRCEHAEQIARVLRERFAQQQRSFWLDRLQRFDVPCSPVNDIDGALVEEQFISRDLIGDRGEGPMVRFPARRRP